MPEFKSEAEERAFWETHDSTEYLDWSKAKLARFPNLKALRRSPRKHNLKNN
ncbi:MAG: CopG family antitoxin [Pseudohongiellaceae bacterium]